MERMEGQFPDVSVASSVWDNVQHKLSQCPLHLLQAFAAWQRQHGREWQGLGPTPLDARSRARMYTSASGQRYPSASFKGLDHLLPPGLGKEGHMAASQQLQSPFTHAAWPEDDVHFVAYTVATWGEWTPILAQRQRDCIHSCVLAVQPLQDALAPHRCASANRVASTKNCAVIALFTTLLRWPDVTQAQQMLLGFPVVGKVPASGVFRSVCQDSKDADTHAWLSTSAKDAVDAIMQQPPSRDSKEILRLTQEEQQKGFCSEFFTRTQMDCMFGKNQWRPLERFLVTQPCGKVRAIDNARRTMHNAHTEMEETIHVVSVDFVASAARAVTDAMQVRQPEHLPGWFSMRLATGATLSVTTTFGSPRWPSLLRVRVGVSPFCMV